MSSAPSPRRTTPSRAGSTAPPASAPGCCSKLADRIEAHADELALLEAANVGKPHWLAEERDPVPGRQPALLRRRGALHGGQGRRRVPRRLHLVHPPRAGGRRRLDRAVELPADDGDLEDRPGAGRRQHGDPQAVGADAAHLAAPRRARRRHLPRRRLQRRHRLRRAGRRRPRAPSEGRHGLDHRRRRHRQDRRQDRRRDA